MDPLLRPYESIPFSAREKLSFKNGLKRAMPFLPLFMLLMVSFFINGSTSLTFPNSNKGFSKCKTKAVNSSPKWLISIQANGFWIFARVPAAKLWHSPLRCKEKVKYFFTISENLPCLKQEKDSKELTSK